MTFYNRNELPRLFRELNIQPPPGIVDYEQDRCTPDTDENATELMTRLFYDREISVLLAEPNIGKTPLAYSIARSLACGQKLDELHRPMGDTRSTLIVSGEMNAQQWGKYKRWNDRMFPLPESAKAFVEIYNCRDKLDTHEGRTYLEGLVPHVNSTHPGQKKVSVLILDNLKALTSDGDSRQRFNEFFDFLDSLRKRHRWTIVVIHHTNKEGDIYGTMNIKAKVDNIAFLGKTFGEVFPKIKEAMAWVRPTKEKKLKDYYDFVQDNVVKDKLAGRYANSVSFFIGLPKGKMFSPVEKLPVFMRMLPEDAQPRWEAFEILTDGAPWSWARFEGPGQGEDGQQDNDADAAIRKSDEVQPDGKPSYEKLLKSRDRELVLKWLRKACTAGCTSHQQMGIWLDLKEDKAKSQIEYLIKKYDIRPDELKDPTL